MNSAVNSAIEIARRTSTAQTYVVFADFTVEIKILNYFPLILIYKLHPIF